MKHSPSDAMILALGGAVSALGARLGDFGDIRDCGVGITPQVCNRVSNPWDMGIFFRPGLISTRQN